MRPALTIKTPWMPALALLLVLAQVPIAARQAATRPTAQPAPAAAVAQKPEASPAAPAAPRAMELADIIAWMTDGVPRLGMEDHLKERANLKKSAAEREKETSAKAAKPGEKK